LIPFISVADLEAILGESIANPGALIVSISLDSACQAVRSYLGQDVNLVLDDVEIHSGSGRRKLRLRQRPVREVTQVKIDDTVIDPTTYTVRGAIITRKDSDIWDYGNDNVEITYSHGWDLDETPEPGWTVERVPADIRLVAVLGARRVYNAVGSVVGAGDVTSETIGDYSYTLSEGSQEALEAASQMGDAERFVLDRYRIELVGDTPTY
jgi:hypothetical protein